MVSPIEKESEQEMNTKFANNVGLQPNHPFVRSIWAAYQGHVKLRFCTAPVGPVVETRQLVTFYWAPRGHISMIRVGI